MKLTDEQIKRAHDVWLDAVKFPPEEMGPTAEAVIRAMAPHLQLPWDEPTREETDSIREFDSLWFACEFVRRRNAALPPKPVDPRIEKIMSILREGPPRPTEFVANEILAALDEVKK